jgi:hypothetical protein
MKILLSRLTNIDQTVKTIASALTFLYFFPLTGCFLREPEVRMTDEYIEVVNPGQFVNLNLVNVLTMDSLKHYPSKDDVVSSYTIAERNNNKDLKGNISFKMYFDKKNSNYYWKAYKDLFLANYEVKDTIHLKPNSWYCVTTEKYPFDVYLFWKGVKGNYEIKLKPKSANGPF